MSSLILRLERLAPDDAPMTDPTFAEDASPPMSSRPLVDLASGGSTETALGRWSAAAAAAQDGCLVLDPDGQIVSLSATAAELLDCSDGGVIGRRLIDVATLIDFDTGELSPDYAERVPPLAALNTGNIARSLIRVRHRDDSPVTLDVCGVPLHDAAGRIVGSLSFVNPLAA